MEMKMNKTTQKKYQNQNLLLLELNGVRYTKLRELINQYENETTLATHNFYAQMSDLHYKEAKQHIIICRKFLDGQIDINELESQLIKATTDPNAYCYDSPEINSSADAIDRSIEMMEQVINRKLRDIVLGKRNFELKDPDQAEQLTADQILQTIKQRQQTKGK